MADFTKPGPTLFWSSLISGDVMAQNPITENQPIEVKSYEEMKKMVYQWILQHLNRKDMVKKKFLINGEILGLNPARIKEIKEEFEKAVFPKKEPVHVSLFKLFKAGKYLIDAIIETGCTYEEAKKTHQQFLESQDKVEVSEKFVIEIYSLASDAFEGEVTTDEDAIYHLDEAVKDARRFRKFTYPCSKCGGSLQLSKTEWPSVRKFLIESGWHHGGECP